MDLNKVSDVKVVNHKYVFNNLNQYKDTYLITDGKYEFKNIPKAHPMAILNKRIIYKGDINKKLIKKVDNVFYDFYYGNIQMEIKSNIDKISVYCFYHGFMGGKNILKYKIKF